MTAPDTLLEVKNLKMHFPIKARSLRGQRHYLKAVDDVTFTIKRGETLGLVGESGCGKTTVGRCIVRAYQPTGGQMLYHEHSDLGADVKQLPAHNRRPDRAAEPEPGRIVDLAALPRAELHNYRQEIRMIFQDPYSSLNPRMTVFDNISEALQIGKTLPFSEIEDRVAYLLRRVGLRPEYIRRYPHAFSGGERQRVVIARALVTNPHLIVADEAVSALDVSVRAQILNLMEELQAEFQLTYLFISHDLSVVRHICDRVVVMYVGKVVEIAEGMDIYINPQHPYTEALMSTVPVSNPLHRDKDRRIQLEGEVADPSNPPTGCYFHPRCAYAQARCRTEAPPLRIVDPARNHAVACHYAEELSLTGVVLSE